MTDDIEQIVEEIIADAGVRHKANAVDYWNALRTVLEWWDELPPILRMVIERNGVEPWAIAKARRAITPQHNGPST